MPDGRTNNVTATACAVYSGRGLVHYITYTIGVPVLRTLTFFVEVRRAGRLVLAIFRWV
jgi:hypothetical protein